MTGYVMEEITKNRLYGISKMLYQEKEKIEDHLSLCTNELFDLDDKVTLYDLTYSKLFIIPIILLNLLFYNIIAKKFSE